MNIVTFPPKPDPKALALEWIAARCEQCRSSAEWAVACVQIEKLARDALK